jgi:N-acetylglucosaminyldiphosphoundecaprenol N-acetyl-beta-D-mannosaminyltransferase
MSSLASQPRFQDAPFRPSVEILGLPVHPLTMAESLDFAEELIWSGGYHQHVVLNAAKLVQAHRDPNLARIIRECTMINADGQSVVWAGRLLGRYVPERVAGIDFMTGLLDRAARAGYRVYLLGAEASVVSAVAELAEHRGVQVVGYRDGYWRADEEPAVVRQVAAAKPDLLFLAIPSPRKEFFLSAHLDALRVPLAVGVGGAFDVVVGRRRRAPRWVQSIGMEWSFRLLQEPRRMYKRYLVGNTRFIALLAREVIHARRQA